MAWLILRARASRTQVLSLRAVVDSVLAGRAQFEDQPRHSLQKGPETINPAQTTVCKWALLLSPAA